MYLVKSRTLSILHAFHDSRDFVLRYFWTRTDGARSDSFSLKSNFQAERRLNSIHCNLACKDLLRHRFCFFLYFGTFSQTLVNRFFIENCNSFSHWKIPRKRLDFIWEPVDVGIFAKQFFSHTTVWRLFKMSFIVSVWFIVSAFSS